MAYLVLTGGTEQGKRFEIGEAVTRIGRRSGNDITLASGSVSGSHAEIVRTEEGLELRDLGSTNGSFLNGKRVDTVRIYRNDIIRLGDVTLMLNGDDVPQAPSDGDADAALLSRSTVAIKPLNSKDLRIAPPPEFVAGRRISHLWPVFLGAILVAVAVAIFLFIKHAYIKN